MQSTSSLRARARESLRGDWPLSIGIAAVAALLGGLLCGSSFLPDLESNIPIHIPFFGQPFQSLRQGLQLGDLTLSFRSDLLGLAAFLLGGPLQLGYTQFLLKQHDSKEREFRDLFSQFHRYGTGFAQQFLRTLYTFLWSLLLIIPGLIKNYIYAMTPFILAEHEDMTASQAISHSMVLMDGHKMDLFLLDLTFIGWSLLAILTLNLGHLALNPYRNAAHAAFYRQLLSENPYCIPDSN